MPHTKNTTHKLLTHSDGISSTPPNPKLAYVLSHSSKILARGYVSAARSQTIAYSTPSARSGCGRSTSFESRIHYPQQSQKAGSCLGCKHPRWAAVRLR